MTDARVLAACEAHLLAGEAAGEQWGDGEPWKAVLETHANTILLCGGMVMKIKKPVKLPYLDFSELDARREACLQEVEVNRRTAPIYVGVCAVVDAGTPAPVVVDVAAGEEPVAGAVEYAVCMKRFPAKSLLARMLDESTCSRHHVYHLAEAVADFHSKAATVDVPDAAARLRAVMEQSLEELRGMASLPGDTVEALAKLAATEAADREALLNARGVDGHNRVCHGDLHAANVFVAESGEAVLFDAIEFDANLQHIDVFYDVAFLVADFLHRGHRDHASTLLNRYLEASKDYDALVLLPLFAAGRAAIRAKVAAVRAATDPAATLEAVAYLELAVSILKGPAIRPTLFAVGGLSGSGKSTVARALSPMVASPLPAIILRSDVIRKHLAGVPDNTLLDPSTGYTLAMTTSTYGAMCRRAKTVLAGGFSVICDATFLHMPRRDEVETAGKEAGAPFIGIWLESDEAVLRARLKARTGDVSDATPAVLDFQKRDAEVGDVTWHIVHSGDGVRPALRELRAQLAAEGQGSVLQA